SVDVFWWGDAKNAMDYWANGLGQHLVTLGTQRTASTATAAYSKNEEPTPKERSDAWCEEQTFGIPTALTPPATPCALCRFPRRERLGVRFPGATYRNG